MMNKSWWNSIVFYEGLLITIAVMVMIAWGYYKDEKTLQMLRNNKVLPMNVKSIKANDYEGEILHTNERNHEDLVSPKNEKSCFLPDSDQ